MKYTTGSIAVMKLNSALAGLRTASGELHPLHQLPCKAALAECLHLHLQLRPFCQVFTLFKSMSRERNTARIEELGKQLGISSGTESRQGRGVQSQSKPRKKNGNQQNNNIYETIAEDFCCSCKFHMCDKVTYW